MAPPRIVLYTQLLILLYVISGDFVSAQDGFFFTIPKVLREGDTSEFCLTAYSSSGNSRNVTFTLINKVNPLIKVEIDDVYIHGEPKCSNFTVPEAETYEMLLFNQTDILHDSVEITVKSHSHLILIQTDKPMYKPGQKVQFRILTMQSNQKARIGTIAAVYIKDPNGSRVKQFLNIDSQGIASLDFQLSKEARLGKWQIAVFLNETDFNANEDGMVSFEVKEYVLPRYEVKITPPNYIPVDAEVVEGKVCAKYTYGKDVRGFLELTVCGKLQYTYRRLENACHHEVVEINGCYIFSANATDLRDGESFPGFGWILDINASITEFGTGAIVTAHHLGPSLTKENVKLAFKDFTNGYFKPGLPFHGQVIATKPDGTPAKDELISVKAFDYDLNIRMTASFTTDEAGIATYSLCGDLSENVTRLSLRAEALNHKNHSKGMFLPTAYGEIKQWFSPSFSYIQIPRTESKHKCGEKVIVRIPFTTQAKTNTEFIYQIIARGKMVTTGTLSYNYDTDHPSHKLGSPSEQNCLIPDPLVKPTEPQIVNPFAGPIIPDVLEPPPPPPMLPSNDNDDEDKEETPPVPPPVNEDVNTSPRSTSPQGVDEDDSVPPPPPPPVSPYDHFMPPGDTFKEPIVRSDFKADVASSFVLNIPISTTMSPKFTLVVHHVLPDGEVVADSMEFHVEPCFDNKVNMSFDKKSVLPGEEVNLRLEAEPGSVCGLGIVDKSVNLLGGSHQITLETIFDKLEALNVRQHSIYSYHSDREYCEKRIKKYINDDHYWDISSKFVDAKQAFKSSGLIVLTDLNLETRPCAVSSPKVYDMGPIPMVGLGGGPLAMPGPRLSFSESVAVPLNSNKRQNKAVDIRSHFPETWLWDLQIVGENSSVDLPQVAPHTITSWIGNAMCMDSEKGVGISSLESLTTFQPFFIHLSLPYSAVRGERLPVLFTVQNYLDKCLHLQLMLDMGKNFEVHNSYQHKEPLCVCPDNSFTAKFYATALDIGSHSIQAKAEIVPGTCNNSVDVDLTYIGLSDAVKRQVLIKAEGVTKDYTHTLYMCASEKEAPMEDVILPLPRDIVKNSERGDIKVIGDIMGPALTNLDNLVRLPTGCGEQNMVGFTPNIFVLKYLSNTGLLTEKIHDDAVKFMEIGYQGELNYRHRDGSFSAFGERDERGSVWLTAFVVKSFAQATPYIFIDPEDIQRSVKFLRLSQSENGCFRETGKVFSSYMMGGLGKRKSHAALTSYVLVALLEAGVNSSETVIVEGFKCVEREFKRAKKQMDVYSLALSAYAHTLDDPFSPTCIQIMKMLESKAKRDGPLKYWNRDGSKLPTRNSRFYTSAPSAEVEMTAYALMAYLIFFGEKAIPHSHEIAMWLSQQRNPYGGFASTQDTVVGLNALSEFALMVHNYNPTDVNVTITGNNIEKTFRVSEKENTKLLLQSVPLKVLPDRIIFTAEGEGCALVQANVRFNKLPQNIGSNKPGYHLKVMPRRYRINEDRCDRRTINIAVGSRRNKKHSQGMSIVTVKMVTSWTPIKDSLIKLKSQFPNLGIKRYEHDETENVVTFYFDEFRRRAREFALDVEQNRELAVTSPKAAQVSVINYYETDVAVIKSYTLKTICGTKEEIPRRRIIIPFDPRIPVPVEQARVEFNEGPPQPPSSTSSPGDIACPICRRVRSIPIAFKGIICNATHIYKTVAGRSGVSSLKIKNDFRPSRRINVNRFANYRLPEGCECSLLKQPVKRVFIMTKSSSLKGAMLTLDSESVITYATKSMERALQIIKRTCLQKWKPKSEIMTS